jgi:hypothetical protein
LESKRKIFFYDFEKLETVKNDKKKLEKIKTVIMNRE